MANTITKRELVNKVCAELDNGFTQNEVLDIIQKTIDPCKKCLADAGDVKIDEVLLVGGKGKREDYKKLFENPSFKALVESPIKRSTPFSPREAILYKSAIGPIGVKSNL